jgi:hypothetical protein
MPAALRLLGRANWWFPRWLDRAVPPFLSEVESESATQGLPDPAISR